jgi:RimJ/RimL family protein N-acetyltransferase
MNQNWIPHPITLAGENVALFPLEREHLKELQQAAMDKRIWEFLSFDCSTREPFYSYYEKALEERQKGEQYPFVIYHKRMNKLIGSTRFLNIDPPNRKLEIGWTWMVPEYWGTRINFECKLLLLTYAFEALKVIRVQLITSDQNLRSQKAIQKIGGVFEGIMRNERIRHNGKPRNSVFYSILDSEWQNAREKILKQIDERQNMSV